MHEQGRPRAPTEMLNQGGTSLRAVRRHINYLNRGGKLEIETDDCEPLKGKGAAVAILNDWDLDMDEERPAADLKPWWETKKPPKLVHKILFSPAGTAPKKVPPTFASRGQRVVTQVSFG